METAFCVETLEDALAHQDKPDMFNADQRSQFSASRVTLCSALSALHGN
jgi:putative transposase